VVLKGNLLTRSDLDKLFQDVAAKAAVCASYFGSYAARSSFSWIIPPPVRGNHSRSSSVNTRVSESSIFPPTPRNSTPMKQFGL